MEVLRVSWECPRWFRSATPIVSGRGSRAFDTHVNALPFLDKRCSGRIGTARKAVAGLAPRSSSEPPAVLLLLESSERRSPRPQPLVTEGGRARHQKCRCVFGLVLKPHMEAERPERATSLQGPCTKHEGAALRCRGVLRTISSQPLIAPFVRSPNWYPESSSTCSRERSR